MNASRVYARGQDHVKWVFCMVLALSVLAIAEVAIAEGSARIVLVGGAEPALGRRLRAEAEAAGLVVVEPGDEVGGADEAELRARYGAAAVIRLVSADRAEVHVGLADGAIARTLTRRPADGESFALRVVEEVYARLVELHLVAPRTDPPAAASESSDVAGARPARSDNRAPELIRPVEGGAEVDRVSERVGGDGADPRLWLSGGLAGTQPSGGIGGTLHGALGVRLEPARRVAVAAQALLPLTENNLSGPEGSADANVNLFIAAIDYALLEPARDFSLNAGVGAGVLLLSMRGEAMAPLAGADDRTTTGVYFAHAGLAWSLASWFRLRAVVLGGLTAPRPVVRFDDREVAAWGRFFAGASLSSEFGLALSGPEARR